MTYYVNNNGMVFELKKSFNDDEHLVWYVFEYDDNEYGASEAYSETKYYNGKLVPYDEYNIKKHPDVKSKLDLVDQAKKQKSDLDKEIYELIKKRNALTESFEKYEPLKLMSDLLTNEKRYMLCVKRWHIRLYDFKKDEVSRFSNYDSESGEPIDYDWDDAFDFANMTFTIRLNRALYGSADEFKSYLKFEGDRSKATKSWDDACGILIYCDTLDEVRDKLLQFYSEQKISRSYLIRHFETLRFPLPKDIQDEVTKEKLEQERQNIERLKEDMERQKVKYDESVKAYEQKTK